MTKTINSPYGLIAELAKGVSAEECLGRLEPMERDEAMRWYHTLHGASAGWRCAGLLELDEQAELVCEQLSAIASGKCAVAP